MPIISDFLIVFNSNAANHAGVFGGKAKNGLGLQAEAMPAQGGVIITRLQKLVLTGQGNGTMDPSYTYS